MHLSLSSSTTAILPSQTDETLRTLRQPRAQEDLRISLTSPEAPESPFSHCGLDQVPSVQKDFTRV
jgi:hypothetical protein